jgi:hypothetical protein
MGHRVKSRVQVCYHHIVWAVPNQKFDPLLRTDQALLVTDIKARINTTLTLLPRAVLQVELLLQLLLSLRLRLRPANVRIALPLYLPSASGNGRTVIIWVPSLQPTMRNVRKWTSRTAAVRLHLLTASRRLRCHATVLRMALTLVALMMAITHRRLPITHPLCLRWLQHSSRYPACQRHRSWSVQNSTSSPLLATWTLTRTTMTKSKIPSRLYPSQNVEARAIPLQTAPRMPLRLLNKNLRCRLMVNEFHSP